MVEVKLGAVIDASGVTEAERVAPELAGSARQQADAQERQDPR